MKFGRHVAWDWSIIERSQFNHYSDIARTTIAVGHCYNKTVVAIEICIAEIAINPGYTVERNFAMSRSFSKDECEDISIDIPCVNISFDQYIFKPDNSFTICLRRVVHSVNCQLGLQIFISETICYRNLSAIESAVVCVEILGRLNDIAAICLLPDPTSIISEFWYVDYQLGIVRISNLRHDICQRESQALILIDCKHERTDAPVIVRLTEAIISVGKCKAQPLDTDKSIDTLLTGSV